VITARVSPDLMAAVAGKVSFVRESQRPFDTCKGSCGDAHVAVSSGRVAAAGSLPAVVHGVEGTPAGLAQ
jgi:hypothetical protein